MVIGYYIKAVGLAGFVVKFLERGDLVGFIVNGKEFMDIVIRVYWQFVVYLVIIFSVLVIGSYLNDCSFYWYIFSEDSFIWISFKYRFIIIDIFYLDVDRD